MPSQRDLGTRRHPPGNAPSKSWVFAAAAIGIAPLLAVPARAAASWVALAGTADARATLEKGRDLLLLVQARPNDSYASIAARYLAPGRPVSGLAEANPGREAVRGGSWYRVPLALVSPSWREKAVRAVFPADGPDENGWVHRPSASPLDTYGEGAWEAALWYTGDGRNFETVLRANGLTDPILTRGADVTVPAHLLLEPFRSSWEAALKESARPRAAATARDGPAPPQSSRSARGRPADPAPPQPPDSASRSRTGKRAIVSPPEDTPRASSGDGDDESDAGAKDQEKEAGDEGRAPPVKAAASPSELAFGEDSQGDYAGYRLKPGEALYSAVVVRFTGRVEPEDVGEAAALIAKRSGIAEMNHIPAGYTVKIPRDMVMPEFLPPEDRRRRAVEEDRREAESVRNPVKTRNLQGIHVILDAGHGGVDPGALIGGVAEHEVAYDVLCRVKRILEAETGAIVHPTIEDPAGGFAPRGGRFLRIGGREKILTTPVHVNADPSDTSLGVNLRWILANAIQRKLAKSGVTPAKIVFASFHADVLHPTLRGTMVYVPGERYRRGSYACYDPDCSRYAEARQASSVSFSRDDRVKSEGLSRELAGELVRALSARGIRIHPYEPVRDRIIRRGRAWLPAVLRGNTVPAKVLVEMANLNNPEDRGRLSDPAFRESFARGFTEALARYYAPATVRPRPAPRTTRRSR